MAGHSSQAAIDYRSHSFDGDGTLRDVGGEDDLGLAARGYGTVLLGLFLLLATALTRLQQHRTRWIAGRPS